MPFNKETQPYVKEKHGRMSSMIKEIGYLKQRLARLEKTLGFTDEDDIFEQEIKIMGFKHLHDIDKAASRYWKETMW